jgi:2-dehydropantoate 2-reductase
MSNSQVQSSVKANDGRQPRIAVAGAGSIGCYVGGWLALAGQDVRLLMRERLAEPISRHGLCVRDLGGNESTAAPETLAAETDPKRALGQADTVLVTVKSSATAEMAKLIARHTPEGATVVSLQNGVGNVQAIANVLGRKYTVVPGMVPFNVVQKQEQDRVRFQRATSGTIQIGDQVPGLAARLHVDGLPVAEYGDMTSMLWSKLVLNMNNALNALSGLPLVQQLADPRWRGLLATQMEEALAAIKASGIGLARIEGVNPKLIPFALRLPTPIFGMVAQKMLDIDPDARSSMWEDMERGRETEIDYLQGAVIDLACQVGLSAPIAERVVALVKKQEKAGPPPHPVAPEKIV